MITPNIVISGCMSANCFCSKVVLHCQPPITIKPYSKKRKPASISPEIIIPIPSGTHTTIVPTTGNMVENAVRTANSMVVLHQILYNQQEQIYLE